MTVDPLDERIMKDIEEMCSPERIGHEISILRQELEATADLMCRAIDERDEARREAVKLRREREMLLDVRSKDGLLSSEWLMRTALAEARANHLRKELDRLIEGVYDAGHYKLCDQLHEQLERMDTHIFHANQEVPANNPLYVASNVDAVTRAGIVRFRLNPDVRRTYVDIRRELGLTVEPWMTEEDD